MSVRVLVVVPTFNRSVNIGFLLDDISRQSEKNLEVVVVDDGSDEGEIFNSRRIVRSYGERFRLIEKLSSDVSKGPGSSRNRGIRISRGDFIAFCDDDDRWLRSDHLELGCRALEKTGADLFWADMQTRKGDEVLNRSMYGEFAMLKRYPTAFAEGFFEVDRRSLSEFFKHRIVHCDSLVVRRSLLDTVGLYWDCLRFAEDHDFAFALRMGLAGRCTEMWLSQH